MQNLYILIYFLCNLLMIIPQLYWYKTQKKTTEIEVNKIREREREGKYQQDGVVQL
jgi:uncharacterized membrane protein